MLAVIRCFVLPIVLVPLVRAVTAIRLEIDRHHLGIREIIPQQVVGNPARSGGCVVGGGLEFIESLTLLGQSLIAQEEDILEQREDFLVFAVGDEPVFIPGIAADNEELAIR